MKKWRPWQQIIRSGHYKDLSVDDIFYWVGDKKSVIYLSKCGETEPLREIARDIVEHEIEYKEKERKYEQALVQQKKRQEERLQKCKGFWRRWKLRNEMFFERPSVSAPDRIRTYSRYHPLDEELNRLFPMKRNVSPPPKQSEEMKKKVLKKCDSSCIKCGQGLHITRMVVAHAFPRRRGGDNALYNYVAMDNQCNRGQRENIFHSILIKNAQLNLKWNITSDNFHKFK